MRNDLNSRVVVSYRPYVKIFWRWWKDSQGNALAFDVAGCYSLVPNAVLVPPLSMHELCGKHGAQGLSSILIGAQTRWAKFLVGILFPLQLEEQVSSPTPECGVFQQVLNVLNLPRCAWSRSCLPPVLAQGEVWVLPSFMKRLFRKLTAYTLPVLSGNHWKVLRKLIFHPVLSLFGGSCWVIFALGKKEAGRLNWLLS